MSTTPVRLQDLALVILAVRPDVPPLKPATMRLTWSGMMSLEQRARLTPAAHGQSLLREVHVSGVKVVLGTFPFGPHSTRRLLGALPFRAYSNRCDRGSDGHRQHERRGRRRQTRDRRPAPAPPPEPLRPAGRTGFNWFPAHEP